MVKKVLRQVQPSRSDTIPVPACDGHPDRQTRDDSKDRAYAQRRAGNKDMVYDLGPTVFGPKYDYKCDLPGIGNRSWTTIDESFTDCTQLLCYLMGIEAVPAPVFCFAFKANQTA